MEGLIGGKIRVFYIFGENLVSAEPDIPKVEHELSSAEFLSLPIFEELNPDARPGLKVKICPRFARYPQIYVQCRHKTNEDLRQHNPDNHHLPFFFAFSIRFSTLSTTL